MSIKVKRDEIRKRSKKEKRNVEFSVMRAARPNTINQG